MYGIWRTKTWLLCSKLNAVKWLREAFFFCNGNYWVPLYLCELWCLDFVFVFWKQLQSTSIFLSLSGKWVWYDLYSILSNITTGVTLFFNIVEYCCLGYMFRLWQLKNKIVQQWFLFEIYRYFMTNCTLGGCKQCSVILDLRASVFYFVFLKWK